MSPIYTRRNLLISLVILLAMFSFFIAFSYRNMKTAVEETRSMNTTLHSLRYLEDIMDDVQDMETGTRGYVISGNREFLKPYNAAIHELKEDTNRIKELYSLYPERKSTYEELLQMIAAKKQRSEEMISLVTAGGTGTALRSAPDKVLMERIREIIVQFETEDRLILNRSNTGRQSAAWNAGRLFIGLTFIFIIAVVLLFWRLWHGLKLRERYEQRIAYLAGLTENTSDAIISTDSNLRIKTWNNAARDMYGYTAKEAIGQTVGSLLNIVSPGRELDQHRIELDAKGHYKGEYEAVKKSGEPIYIQASVSMLRARKNEPGGYVAIHRDITELRKSAQLLKIFNEKLSLQVEEKTAMATNILERISDGFYSLDDQWNFTYMNKPAAAMMGCDPQEIIGKNLWKEFPDAVQLSIYKGYHDAFKEQTYRQVEFYYPPFDRWFTVDIYPSHSGLSTFFRDITERRKAEEELKHSNERFEMICRTTNDAVWEWDFETGTMWGNETHQHLYGLTLADPVPSETEWQQRIHPEDRQRLVNKQAEALASDTNIFITEYRFNTVDNGYRNIYDRCYIVRDENGKATRILGSMMDITDLKKAEERLKTREAQLAASIENTPNVAVQWYNSKGEITYWNHASELLYGWISAEAMGKTLDQLILSPEKAAHFFNVLQQVSDTGVTVGPSEYPFRRKNGTRGFCMATIFPIPSVEGEPYFVCMDVDITDSKQYAEALRQSEEKYRLIIDQASDGIFVLDEHANYVDVNAAGLAMTGYSKEELLQMTAAQLLPRGEQSVIVLKRDDLKLGKTVVTERKLFRKDGSFRFVEVSYKMLSNGLVVGIKRDITERKKAEQELITSEKTRRLIMNSALDAIVCMDTTGRITIWTPQAEKIFGWTETEVIGKIMGEIIVPAHYRAAHERGLQRYLQTGETKVMNRILEITALHRSGREFPVELSILSVKQDGDEFFCAFIRDITERKQAEDAIRKAHERYEMIGKATNDAIWDINMRTMEKWGNDSLYHLYGLDRTKDNLEKLELYSRTHPDDVEKLKLMLSDAFRERAPYIVMEFRFRMPDGVYKTFLDRAFIQYDENGEPLRLIGAMQDITERKKTEQAVKESEEKYRTLVEQAVDAIALYNADGKILDVNTGSVNLLGYSKEELMQMYLPDILTREEILEKPVRYDVLQEGNSTVKYRKMRKKDGQEIDTEVRSQQLPDGRFLSVIRDLTERIKAEKELAASYEAIRKLTGHIQDIREEERTNIAREIHDELGQQLTVLKMDVSWLKKKMLPAEEPVRQKLNELIAMLDQTVKTVRRISSELRPSILDDLGLVAAMEWQLGEFQKRSDITAHFIHPDTELIALPDTIKTALFRILQESLTNVARHASATEVTVKITAKPDRLVLSIADNGVGFDKQKIAGKKTLGILGMQERIAMIGGEYEIKSRPSGGTEVIVELALNNNKPGNV